MGKASNAAKQRWNAAHYTQVKVSVTHDTASAFKAACVKRGISMAGAIAAFMSDFANPSTGSPTHCLAGFSARQSEAHALRVASLKDRRKVMASVRNLIAQLISSENNCIQNVPKNLQTSENYELAQERLALLEEVFDSTRDIYD